jgi:VanZ family protein
MAGSEGGPNLRFRAAALALWCGVIFAFSQIPGSGSGIEPPLWYVIERKSAHLVEYAVLFLLAYRFFRVLSPGAPFARVALLSGALAVAYGALDEFHQLFVFGRGARFTDVFVDGAGAFIGFAILWAFRSRSIMKA